MRTGKKHYEFDRVFGPESLQTVRLSSLQHHLHYRTRPQPLSPPHPQPPIVSAGGLCGHQATHANGHRRFQRLHLRIRSLIASGLRASQMAAHKLSRHHSSGQTGSGKTFTMTGEGGGDGELLGIGPCEGRDTDTPIHIHNASGYAYTNTHAHTTSCPLRSPRHQRNVPNRAQRQTQIRLSITS